MERVDVAIVGGGVIGAATAFQLLQSRPGLRVALIERGLVGHGASARSAGVHVLRGGTPRVREMSLLSHMRWREWSSRHHLPIRELPTVVVADENSKDRIAEQYFQQAAIRRTDRSALDAPGFRPPDGTAVWEAEGSHYADVEDVAGRLVRAVRDRASVWEGSEVVGLRPLDGATAVDLGQGRTLTAASVVLAPGPWIRHPAWADLLAPLGVRVKKIVALHIEHEPRRGRPLTILQDDDAFIVPYFERGHLLFSYTCDEWDVDPDRPLGALDDEALQQGRAVLRRYFPDLADACVSGRVFCDTYSPHREPVIRAVADGVFYAGAANGSGYRLAPAVADAVQDLISKRDKGAS
ncbi:NAD(P)/FAD-dependent oxidoreductase [Glycomyces xiaoerkulensis]|uniref:NAD(P)/FAD-dependent oxidoreductase n=1 Tax=Glycomyces xiaoerkulensis TaxID=2038139 RepID=UPI0012FFFF02|nr:FAD-dependent oxidoreductase [Glycomyces xiaoerkulensis]